MQIQTQETHKDVDGGKHFPVVFSIIK